MNLVPLLVFVAAILFIIASFPDIIFPKLTGSIHTAILAVLQDADEETDFYDLQNAAFSRVNPKGLEKLLAYWIFTRLIEHLLAQDQIYVTRELPPGRHFFYDREAILMGSAFRLNRHANPS